MRACYVYEQKKETSKVYIETKLQLRFDNSIRGFQIIKSIIYREITCKICKKQ